MHSCAFIVKPWFAAENLQRLRTESLKSQQSSSGQLASVSSKGSMVEARVSLLTMKRMERMEFCVARKPLNPLKSRRSSGKSRLYELQELHGGSSVSLRTMKLLEPRECSHRVLPKSSPL